MGRRVRAGTPSRTGSLRGGDPGKAPAQDARASCSGAKADDESTDPPRSGRSRYGHVRLVGGRMKAIDSNLLIYASLANHPATVACEQYVAASPVWVTNIVNLFIPRGWP